MPKLKKILYLTFLLAGSCQQTATEQSTKTLDFGAFTIEVPNAWQRINASGVDSYIADIAIDSSDTVSFDLGPHSNTLTEYDAAVFISEKLFDSNLPDTSEGVVVERFRLKEIDQYKRQNLLWDTIDGREVKIVYPRKPGIGLTGMYIDSLRTSKLGIDHFNFYGEDLKQKNQKLFLQALKTIKFRKSD